MIELLGDSELRINSKQERLMSIKDKRRRLINIDACDANHNPLLIANVSETHNEIRRLQLFASDKCL
jgi:hypothetical protein